MLGIDCCIMLLASFYFAAVVCAALGLALVDLPPDLALKPLAFWVIAYVVLVAGLLALPLLVLLLLKRSGAGLIAAGAPFVIVVLILWWLRPFFL